MYGSGNFSFSELTNSTVQNIFLCFLGLQNPIDTIYHLQPVMALGLLPLAFIIEGKSLFMIVESHSLC